MFASGAGSNFEVLARAAATGDLGGEIVALLCDRPGAPVLERARRFGIEALVLPSQRFRTRLDDEAPWLEALAQREVRRVPGDTLAQLEARVHEAEHALYPATVKRFLTEPWRVDGARVRFGEGAGVAHG